MLSTGFLLGWFPNPPAAASNPKLQSQSHAATDPQFEVASVRPSSERRPVDSMYLALLHAVAEHPRNGRFQLDAVPTSVLIELAYDLKDFQIKGLPAWATTEEYDVDARAEAGQTFEQMRPMLRSLLGERLHLRSHPDTAQAGAFDLELAKSGLKIAPTAPGSCTPVDPNRPSPPEMSSGKPAPLHVCGGTRMALRLDHSKELEAVGITMPAFAKMLSDEVGEEVLDETSLTGTFDIRLKFTPGGDEAGPVPGSDTDVPSAPSLLTALQEQLGLRLQHAKHPVQVLVIDQLTRPSRN